jgi:hypothetical protein
VFDLIWMDCNSTGPLVSRLSNSIVTVLYVMMVLYSSSDIFSTGPFSVFFVFKSVSQDRFKFIECTACDSEAHLICRSLLYFVPK